MTKEICYLFVTLYNLIPSPVQWTHIQQLHGLDQNGLPSFTTPQYEGHWTGSQLCRGYKQQKRDDALRVEIHDIN